MRRVPIVLSALAVLLLAPVVAVLVHAWAQGWTLASVTTGSMRPGTAPGSMVVIAPVSPADVELGDVVGYRDERAGRIVTHRVVAVLDQPTGRFFTTQGDANPRPDARPVPARAVVGEVRWRIAGLGSLAEAARDRRVQLALGGVPFALLLLSELAGWRSRRLGAVIAALRAELAHLRAATSAADPAVAPHAAPPMGAGPSPTGAAGAASTLTASSSAEAAEVSPVAASGLADPSPDLAGACLVVRPMRRSVGVPQAAWRPPFAATVVGGEAGRRSLRATDGTGCLVGRLAHEAAAASWPSAPTAVALAD